MINLVPFFPYLQVAEVLRSTAAVPFSGTKRTGREDHRPPGNVMVVFNRHTDDLPCKISLLVCPYNVATLQGNLQPRLRDCCFF